MIKFLVAEKTLEKMLGCGLRDNNKTSNTNLFQKVMAVLVGGISLQNYIC